MKFAKAMTRELHYQINGFENQKKVSKIHIDRNVNSLLIEEAIS